ncbi:MAG TPA: ricin-type beta-trefoil lectin domain protein [Pseudonocardiaceae bacterium]
MVALLVGGNTASATPSASRATQQAFITMYGWYDNTPPSASISYPTLHQTAGGTGTFADPITYASDKSETPPGTKIYVPRVQKYFVMEDDCSECDADWKGHGPDGGPNLWHFDLWLGGKGGNAISAIECEDALTNYNPDNTPKLESVIVNAPSGETVSSAPLFNTGNGNCYGGAKPIITVGQYKNKSTSTCLNVPGASTKSGTVLGMAACNNSAGEQLIFDGTFFSLGKVANQSGALCAASSGGNITFKTCNGGPTQQWSANTNNTISDIQTGRLCFRASGTKVSAGSCSGGGSAVQWTFPTTVYTGPGA